MRPAKPAVDSPFSRLLRRLAWVGGVVAVLWFALQGGEYDTLQLLRSRTRKLEREAEVARARASLDSLKEEYKKVTTDPARLERLAREEYGMVKGDKELLYWVSGATSDTAIAPKDSEKVTSVKPPRG